LAWLEFDGTLGLSGGKTTFLLIAPFIPQPVNLDAISINRANHLHGKPVVASFIVGKPLYTLKGKTIIGTNDKPDGIERTAVLLGRRLDFREGSRTRSLEPCG
jgi:hypothetical protein